MKITGARKINGAKIMADTQQGYMVLKHKFSHRDDPKLIETLMKIREKGEIDPRFWRKPYKGEL